MQSAYHEVFKSAHYEKKYTFDHCAANRFAVETSTTESVLSFGRAGPRKPVEKGASVRRAVHVQSGLGVARLGSRDTRKSRDFRTPK